MLLKCTANAGITSNSSSSFFYVERGILGEFETLCFYFVIFIYLFIIIIIIIFTSNVIYLFRFCPISVNFFFL